MNYICFNGKFFPDNEPVLTAGNSSFKWGEGLFETIRILNRKILLEVFHSERLVSGMHYLGIPVHFKWEEVAGQILELCEKNRCTEHARVRLAVYRDETNRAGYLVEARPIPEHTGQWNAGEGLRTAIYPFATKTKDVLSTLKTASYLPYIQAARYAEEQGLDDVLLLNSDGCLADSSRANIFLIKKGELYTPAPDQGCVAGVYRRFLLEELQKRGYTIHQSAITEKQLLDADEVFLTNAIRGIQWVKSYQTKTYRSDMTYSIYKQIAALSVIP